MWRWIKPWRDWAMRELFWPFHRNGGPQAQALHFSYEKAGVLVRNEPIPWNADAIVVEALIKFPSSLARRKTDFHLHLPDQPPLAAVTLHRHEDNNLFRLQFRLPPLRQTTVVELSWRSYLLSQAVLPLLTPQEFVDNLRLEDATVSVRLGKHTVPCQAFIGSQGRGLIAAALLNSASSLVPLLDMDLAVEFKDHRKNQTYRVPVHLGGCQLAGNRALVTAVAPRRPTRLGVWSVSWVLGDRVLARNEVRILSQRSLRRSLYLVESRYVLQDANGIATMLRHMPGLDEKGRLGPCFLVASKERGMAALCPLDVRVQFKGAERSPVLLSQEVLVTDGPSLFMPGTLGPNDLQEIIAFELLSKGQSLGILSTCPAPVANFTSEGGFKPPEEYSWSPSADEELSARLGKLLELPME